MNKRKYNHHILFDRSNFILVGVGVGLMVLGYLLMVGGGYIDEMNPNYDAKYGFQRTVLAPMLILLGLAVNGFAIMKKPSEERKKHIEDTVLNAHKKSTTLEQLVNKEEPKKTTLS